MAQPKISLPSDKLTDFCRRYRIQRMSLFGSVLRDDFRPDSDVDVLVEVDPNAHWSLFDWVSMQNELKAIIGRDVDLVERSAIEQSENYIRRRSILKHLQVIYAA